MGGVAVVDARGLGKQYERTCALHGVDLRVEAGEVRGLLGANGAGKTTLLRILLGLVRPDAGRVELFGRPLSSGDPGALAAVAGFVEEPSFYPYLSGRVNLELLAELDGGGPPARIDDALARVGLAHRARDRVSGYSTGMRQRLGIAACLLRAPRLLLLDEPTSGLDPAGVREVQALVRELAAGGVAVVLSSHQIGEVEDVCDSYTVLRRGEVAWDGAAGELRAQAPASAYRLATSDDARALAVAEGVPGVTAVASGDGALAVSAQLGGLDELVLALGSRGVAVRRLELLVSPLEAMFFALTSEQPAAGAGEPRAAEVSTR